MAMFSLNSLVDCFAAIVDTIDTMVLEVHRCVKVKPGKITDNFHE